MRRIIPLALLVLSAQASAAWQYEEVHDDFDDTTSYILQVASSIPVQGTGGQEHHPFLQLRCDEAGGQPYWRIHWFAVLDVDISTNQFVGVIENPRMRVMIDGKADNRPIWTWLRDETLQAVTTARAPGIVNALSKATELKVRIAGTLGKAYDATFDVSGLDSALEQLRPHCKRL